MSCFYSRLMWTMRHPGTNSATCGSRIIFSVPFSYISFSSFTFPGALYRISVLFLPWLPCHFYLVAITKANKGTGRFETRLWYCVADCTYIPAIWRHLLAFAGRFYTWIKGIYIYIYLKVYISLCIYMRLYISLWGRGYMHQIVSQKLHQTLRTLFEILLNQTEIRLY